MKELIAWLVLIDEDGFRDHGDDKVKEEVKARVWRRT
jgi:hypothetical protein